MQGRRSPQAMAGRKRDGEERGRPPQRRHGQRDGIRSTAPEARQGQPGASTRLDPPRRGATRGREAEASGQRASPRPAAGASDHAEDAEVGQAHDRGKDVPDGRSPHRPLLPDTVGPEPQQSTARRGRANQAQADQRPRLRDRSRGVEAERWLACWPALHTEAARGVDHGTAAA